MSKVQTRLSYPVKKRGSLRSSKSQSNAVINISSDSEEHDCKSAEKSKDVTPPKQRRLITPITTKNDENVSPATPSSLLTKLELDSDEKQSRRQLFADNVDNNNNVRYENARKALHSSVPKRMPARDEQLEFLSSFMTSHLESGTSGTLYVSGPPGTGKTAAIIKTLTELEATHKYKEVLINCTSIKSAQSIYMKIANELGLKIATSKTEACCLTAIETYLNTKHKTIILVLDEIDQLDSRKQSILYTIFEWPSRPNNSNLILIGIANALDLTDRVLPRLQTRCELKPELIHFAPYTKQQIIEIILDRLNVAGVTDLFSPVAIQMLASKVSAVTGDIRMALDIARRVVDILGTEQRQRCPLQATNLNSVGLNQVVSVLNNVYGTCQNLQQDVDESVPLQQKLLLCSLVLILKKGRNKDVTVGRLNEVYRKVCSKRNLSIVGQNEVIGLCSLLETRGMVKVHGRKEPKLNRVCLEWDEDEVATVLQDKHLLSSILDDASVLAK